MIVSAVAIFVSLVQTVCTNPVAAPPSFDNFTGPGYTKTAGSIITIGDSTTELGYSVWDQGWVSVLSDAFRRRNDVYNRGYSGYNSEWYSAMLPSVLKDTIGNGPAPALITIMLGTNDAHADDIQFVSLDRYETNLRNMISYIRQTYPQSPVIGISPPPPTKNRDPAAVFQYRTRLLQLFADEKAKRNDPNLVTIDTWSLFLGGSPDSFDFNRNYNKDSMEQYLKDGIHFSQSGNNRFYNAILDVCRQYFPQLKPTYGIYCEQFKC